MSDRHLTVICRGGLCNRIKVLLSGLALAEASDRHFTMLWPLNRACGAPFTSLFLNPWDVQQPTPEARRATPLSLGGRPVPDLLSEPSSHLVVAHHGWIVKAAAYPAHAPLERRCRELIDALEPIPLIRDAVTRFMATRFRPTMIGVHLRRGDFLRHRPDVCANTNAALAHVERFLEADPDAGILLCTDDGARDHRTRETVNEGVVKIFRDRFGGRVVSSPPRSLDRGTPEAIQDGLIEFLLLRQTQSFVGTSGSSFSTLAIFGRDVPAVLCGEPLPTHTRAMRFLRVHAVDYLTRIGILIESGQSVLGRGWTRSRTRRRDG
jgi:hypothetical protein